MPSAIAGYDDDVRVHPPPHSLITTLVWHTGFDIQQHTDEFFSLRNRIVWKAETFLCHPLCHL